jgi:hypothetical protein
MKCPTCGSPYTHYHHTLIGDPIYYCTCRTEHGRDLVGVPFIKENK